jgi:hypothetical protein
MTGANEKSRLAGNQATLESKNTVTHSDIGDRLQEDPLIGWFGLAAGVKASKLRPMKRGWQRKGGR